MSDGGELQKGSFYLNCFSNQDTEDRVGKTPETPDYCTLPMNNHSNEGAGDEIAKYIGKMITQVSSVSIRIEYVSKLPSTACASLMIF